MATEAAHFRTLEQFLSPDKGNPGIANLPPAAENLVAASSTCIQHMQKTLTQMNVQLANVISDISGVTGMAILRAIVAGERDRRD